jgi:hypothetical protein
MREMRRIIFAACCGWTAFIRVSGGFAFYCVLERDFNFTLALANRSGKLRCSNRAMGLPNRHDADQRRTQFISRGENVNFPLIFRPACRID